MSSVLEPHLPGQDTQRLLDEACQLLAQQRLLEAAKVYAEVINRTPDCVEALCKLGCLLFQFGQAEAALASFQRAARCSPATPKLHFMMGAVLQSLGRLEEAAVCCEKEIWLAPADAEARYQLGLVLQALKKPADAIESFEQAVRLRPEYVAAWVAMGKALRQTATPAAALECFDRAIQLDPLTGAMPASPGSVSGHQAGLPDGASVLVSEEPAPLFYPGQTGRGFGWGVCNWHLMHELSRLIPVRKLEPNDPLFRSQSLPGNLFVPLGGGDFSPYSPARGRHNFGYVFFEQELQPKAREIARGLDLVFAGSTWCLKRMQEQGIANCALLIQGVDTQVFHPQAASKSEFFVLFSGGKFELRKGQDLVLKAFSILSRKYPDMVLATAWHNVWPETMKSMRASPHIRFESIQGSWMEQMEHLYRLNGIDPQRVRTMGNLRREEMAEVYRASDLGLFPNRCEGGTNLVLMEYMACGKPAIATDASGHKDVCHESNSFPLRSLRPFVQRDTNGQVVNRWVEPSLDEIIALVEDAYQHPSKARTLGEVAAADMRQWSWQRAANTIISTLGQVAGRRGA